jgi:photosystem II stability/assembly factor-like uncharacterized protein
MSDNGQIVFAGGKQYVLPSMTRDGGATWSNIGDTDSPWWNTEIYGSDMTSDGETILFNMTGTIYRSDDCGVTWRSLGYLVAATPIADAVPVWMYKSYALSISKDGQKIIAVVYGRGLFVSLDGGTTWTEQFAGNWSTCVMSKNGRNMLAAQWNLAGGTGRVYMARNGGDWAEIQPYDTGTHDWICLSTTDSGHVVFAGMALNVTTPEDHGLFMSLNYGKTWEPVSPQVPRAEQGWVHLSYRSTGASIALGYGTSFQNRLYKSSALPLAPTFHSFPWLGKFQLSHVTA